MKGKEFSLNGNFFKNEEELINEGRILGKISSYKLKSKNVWGKIHYFSELVYDNGNGEFINIPVAFDENILRKLSNFKADEFQIFKGRLRSFDECHHLCNFFYIEDVCEKNDENFNSGLINLTAETTKKPGFYKVTHNGIEVLTMSLRVPDYKGVCHVSCVFFKNAARILNKLNNEKYRLYLSGFFKGREFPYNHQVIRKTYEFIVLDVKNLSQIKDIVHNYVSEEQIYKD